jgi:hypothetical protein
MEHSKKNAERMRIIDRWHAALPLSVSWCGASRLRKVFDELLEELLIILHNVRFVYRVSFNA